MITLTTPPQVTSVLGGTAKVGYDRLVLAPATLHPVARTIEGQVRITSTAAPAMNPIIGTFRISVPNATLEVAVADLDFYRRVSLTGPQVTAVQTLITDAQTDLEAGFISLGVIDGAQSAGV